MKTTAAAALAALLALALAAGPLHAQALAPSGIVLLAAAQPPPPASGIPTDPAAHAAPVSAPRMLSRADFLQRFVDRGLLGPILAYATANPASDVAQWLEIARAHDVIDPAGAQAIAGMQVLRNRGLATDADIAAVLAPP